MWVKGLVRLLTRVRPCVRDETLRKLLTECDQLLLFTRSPFPASSTCRYSLNFIRLRTISKLKILRGSSRQSRMKQVWSNWSSGLPVSRHLNPKLFQYWRQRKVLTEGRWSSTDLLCKWAVTFSAHYGSPLEIDTPLTESDHITLSEIWQKKHSCVVPFDMILISSLLNQLYREVHAKSKKLSIYLMEEKRTSTHNQRSSHENLARSYV